MGKWSQLYNLRVEFHADSGLECSLHLANGAGQHWSSAMQLHLRVSNPLMQQKKFNLRQWHPPTLSCVSRLFCLIPMCLVFFGASHDITLICYMLFTFFNSGNAVRSCAAAPVGGLPKIEFGCCRSDVILEFGLLRDGAIVCSHCTEV